MGAFALVHELAEDKADDFRPIFIDSHFAVFYIIAEHTAPEHNALLHLAFLSPFDTLGSLAAFLLCDRGHNGKAKLCIAVQGVDVVV